MIFKIDNSQNKTLQKYYDSAMKELNEFYGLGWTRNRPQVIILPDRKTIDYVWDRKSEDWQIGWVNGRIAFILDNEAIEKESCHKKYSPKQYYTLVKHELSHIFFKQMAGNGYGPKWFWEGVAIYTSDQLAFVKPIEKFRKFLDSINKTNPGLYEESGWVVKLLVEKYGKGKLLNLIKSLSQCKNNADFNRNFEKIYSFKPTYGKFNSMMSKIKK